MLLRRCHFFVALVLTTLIVAYRALNGHMALVLVDAASRAGTGQQTQQEAPVELLPQEAAMTSAGPKVATLPVSAQAAKVAVPDQPAHRGTPVPARAEKGRTTSPRVEAAPQAPLLAAATKPPVGPDKCPEPPPVGPLEEPPPSSKIKRDIRRDLVGQKLVWCHDGRSGNGHFVLKADGSTGGDFPKWDLHLWEAIGDREVSITKRDGNNEHRLVFNCELTGFAVVGRRQRGFLDGRGFKSPDGARAPRSAEEVLDCNVKPYKPSRVPVWVWWDWKDKIPTMFRLNLRTWERHIPKDKFELHLLSPSTIHRFLPGIPEAFFRLYHAAKSDFLRAALLAVHGGVYLDGDMLLSHDLDVAVAELLEDKVDILPYEGPGDHCPGSYTTNFMAGKKGNALSKKWIETTLRKMVQTCRLPESQNHREPVNVCCYQKDWCPRNECHVAWGDISHPPKHVRDVRQGCIKFNRGFSSTMTGKELFWTFAKEKGKAKCWLNPSAPADLVCDSLQLREFWLRSGHHLYNMLNGHAIGSQSEEAVLAGDTVVAELYRRSLNISKA